MATMSLVTVASETLCLRWNNEVEKLIRTRGVVTVTIPVTTKAWNFFQTDSFAFESRFYGPA